LNGQAINAFSSIVHEVCIYFLFRSSSFKHIFTATSPSIQVFSSWPGSRVGLLWKKDIYFEIDRKQS
jgi:hypothetical protein